MKEDAGRAAPGGRPGVSQREVERAQGADAERAVAEGRGGTEGDMGSAMARRGAGQERVRMGDRMQRPAHEGRKEGRRAWTAGCGLDGLGMSTQEEGGWGRAEGMHEAGDGHGDTVGQEVVG